MLDLNKTLKKGAVTGGLSCGKSSVCQFFKELGAYVISADEIVHELLFNDQKVIQKVITLLGSDILKAKRIDRAKMAKKVFNQPSLLQSLEDILHPAVQEVIEKQYELKKKEGLTPLFIAEIPLLFESKNKSNFNFDFTIAVIADEEVCKKRFNQITEYGDEEFKKRQKRQLSNQEKAEKADYVIINNGSLAELKDMVFKLYTEITFYK